VVGEYGTLSARSVESIMDKLAAIPDTQAATEEVRGLLPSAESWQLCSCFCGGRDWHGLVWWAAGWRAIFGWWVGGWDPRQV
jgi:hypothetical protein